jgi:Family of unknown function (DUF6152)
MIVNLNALAAAVLLGIASMSGAPSAWAHHSGAMFDRTKVVTIHGIVREFLWTNPHSSFKVDVAGADGAVKTWLIEMNSPNNIVREGWKRTTLKPGAEVTVAVNPLRDGRPGGWYVGIAFPDGKTLGDPLAKGESVPPGEATTP